MHIFSKKSFDDSRKVLTFAVAIGLWCNGNTADSGPAFPGSSPGSPTQRREPRNAARFSSYYYAGVLLFGLLGLSSYLVWVGVKFSNAKEEELLINDASQIGSKKFDFSIE